MSFTQNVSKTLAHNPGVDSPHQKKKNFVSIFSTNI